MLHCRSSLRTDNQGDRRRNRILYLDAAFALARANRARLKSDFWNTSVDQSDFSRKNRCGISAQGPSIAPQKGRQVGSADFLLALEEAFHVHGQTPGRFEQRFDGLDVREELAFVVACAASVQEASRISAANGGLFHSLTGSAGCTS